MVFSSRFKVASYCPCCKRHLKPVAAGMNVSGMKEELNCSFGVQSICSLRFKRALLLNLTQLEITRIMRFVGNRGWNVYYEFVFVSNE